MNTSGVFVISTPDNENDLIDVTPSSVNGFCVDVVLENWTESSVGVILGNDPALVRAILAGFFITTIPDIIISSFLIVLILSPMPISSLQLKISHQPS